ncbi:hypothetical protein [Leptolyngbya sp. NIES-2104]|uniref:hypothetical protein n=1 Tax=Leptolyngbya sp. NIES-2104 TaxID=1552121 RepID=UPI0006EC738C|nr:hypothetical protein [Leptolyngbya sp. NIES-2104]GAP95428.1 hypothetical protein NIES2104_19500 [Leptolyngbya sp. NIES-2104]
MLDTLTLHLNTIQQISQTRSFLFERTDQVTKLADEIEVLCQTIDFTIDLIQKNWDSLPEDERQLIRKQQCLIDRALENQQGWSGLINRLSLLPESIRRGKNLQHCFVQSLSRLEDAISDKIARQSIRDGWKDVMTGNTIPLSELWDGLDDE